MKRNKVVNVPYWGGFMSFFNSPKNRLNACIESHNNEGWSVKFIIAADNNIFYKIWGTIVLFCTVLVYMPLSGQTIIFEKIDR